VAHPIEAHQFAARDWLDGYARLLEWAALVRLLPAKNLRALTKKMHGDPAAATRALSLQV
jgi:hypothetical protein